ncbi:MAG: restriction endonuclease subunit S, partial [bacterium]
MTPQELKNSILQLAIQGKLVEQRPEEGTAEELYQQIQAEKQALIQAGKIKKEKPLPEITEDEIPFEIPESWKWVRFGFLSQLLDGEKRQGEPYPCLDAKYLRGKSEALYLNSGKFVYRGEKIILVDGENSGEVFVVPQDGYMGSTFKKLFYSSAMYEQYVLFFLLYHKKDYRNNKKGSAIPHLNKELFFNMPTPIPPLAEQKRIVAKIEELLPLIERYEKAWSRMEDFNKRFPGDMRKSILQMAIQGKLVEQRPEEGTAEELYQQIQAEKQAQIKAGKIKKEKPLPEIKEDEIPFEIPESWKWVKLCDILSVQPANGFSPKGVEYPTPYKNLTLTATTSGFFRPNAFKYVDISAEVAEKYYLEDEDILIQRSNSREYVGTPCVFRHGSEEYIYPDLMMRIHLMDKIDVDYIACALKAPFCRAYFQNSAAGTSESMPKINQNTVRNTLIPLPPLAEQKRIVARLEELL